MVGQGESKKDGSTISFSKSTLGKPGKSCGPALSKKGIVLREIPPPWRQTWRGTEMGEKEGRELIFRAVFIARREEGGKKVVCVNP